MLRHGVSPRRTSAPFATSGGVERARQVPRPAAGRAGKPDVFGRPAGQPRVARFGPIARSKSAATSLSLANMQPGPSHCPSLADRHDAAALPCRTRKGRRAPAASSWPIRPAASPGGHGPAVLQGGGRAPGGCPAPLGACGQGAGDGADSAAAQGEVCRGYAAERGKAVRCTQGGKSLFGAPGAAAGIRPCRKHGCSTTPASVPSHAVRAIRRVVTRSRRRPVRDSSPNRSVAGTAPALALRARPPSGGRPPGGRRRRRCPDAPGSGSRKMWPALCVWGPGGDECCRALVTPGKGTGRPKKGGPQSARALGS